MNILNPWIDLNAGAALNNEAILSNAYYLIIFMNWEYRVSFVFILKHLTAIY